MNSKNLFHAIIDYASAHKYPDIHLNANYKPFVRQHNGELETLETIVSQNETTEIPILEQENLKDFIIIMCGEEALKKLEATQELDGSYIHQH